MPVTFMDLVRVEDLGADRFVAHPAGGPGFLFGGLTMAMAVAAAARTVEDGMVPLSLRCSFVSFGTWGSTDIEVERVNTSRSFAGRRLRLVQGTRMVAVVDVTFHRPETGPEVEHLAAPSLGAPDTLPALHPEFGAEEPIAPFDMRSARGGGPTPLERIHPFWACTSGPLPEGPGAHAAALAFLSDYLVVASPFSPGTSEGEGLSSRTLEHSVWYHRTLSADRWMLFDCVPISQSAGRFVSRGTVHDEAGSLVASFVQEGFLRAV